MSSCGALLESIWGGLDVAGGAGCGELFAGRVFAVAGAALGVGGVLDGCGADRGAGVASCAVLSRSSLLRVLFVRLVARGAVEDGAVDHLVRDHATFSVEARGRGAVAIVVARPAFGGGGRGQVRARGEELVARLAGKVLHTFFEHARRGVAGLARPLFGGEVMGPLTVTTRALQLCLLCMGHVADAVRDLELAPFAGFMATFAQSRIGVSVGGVGFRSLHLSEGVEPCVL
jgi:hypothetical protein